MRKLLSRLARFVPSPFAPSLSSSATRTPPRKPSSKPAPDIKSAPGPSAPTPPPETGHRAVRRANHPSAYFNHNRAHRLYREHRWHRSHRAQHLLRLPRVLQSASEAHAHSTGPSAESRRARSPNSGVPGVGTGALDPLRLVARSKFRLLRLRWEPTATATAGPQTPPPASAPPLSYLDAFHRLRRTAENAHSASEPSTSSTNPTPTTPTTRANLNALAASPLDRLFDALHLAMDERHRPPTVTYAERSPSPEPTPLPAGHPFASSIAAGSRTLVPPSLPPRAASPSPSVLSQRSTRSNRSQRPPSPDHYIRDPHRLVAYVLPFPQPQLSADVPPPPLRFLIYTPPPPPLLQPPEGEKEKTTTKVQRKWQEEVRAAHESKDKVASWRGLKSRVTKGVNWAVHKTTTADLDFLTRIPSDGEKFRRAVKDRKDRKDDVHPKDSAAGLLPNPEGLAPPRSSRSSMDSHVSATDDEADTTGATVKLEEMVLIYPPSMEQSPEQIREEFVNSLLRTKSKAQRDAVIATGLLPVSAALDWALVFVGWVFGGALEVDAVWAASSFRGAKIARSVTKRLSSSVPSGDASSEDSLRLSFVPSTRVLPLQAYLGCACAEVNAKRFAWPQHLPSEGEVLETMGWDVAAHHTNWEDEAWERDQVAEDLKRTMDKAAKAWDKWCSAYEKNPEKAVKK